MPAIISATVVHWKVEDSEVVFEDSKRVHMYVEDDAEEAAAPEIIAEYIIKSDKGKRDELLAASRDGLLEVLDIYRLELRRPPLPTRVKKPPPKKAP
jgi:hypothetical protein